MAPGIHRVANDAIGRSQADEHGAFAIGEGDGAHVWTSGQEGEGPGDFRSITGLYLLPGDSIGVFDTGLVRYSVMSSAE